MEIKTATINDKKIAYTSETKFLIEVGKNKSAYKSRYSEIGNLSQAIMNYKMINVGNGYKKRLAMQLSGKKLILARQFS